MIAYTILGPRSEVLSSTCTMMLLTKYSQRSPFSYEDLHGLGLIGRSGKASRLLQGLAMFWSSTRRGFLLKEVKARPGLSSKHTTKDGRESCSTIFTVTGS